MSTCNSQTITKVDHLYPFEINDDYFLFDTESLKVALISKDMYRFVKSFINNPSNLNNENFDKSYIDELTHFARKLPSFKKQELSVIPERYCKFNKMKTVQDLTLVVCEDCNLRCEYCYLIEKLNNKSYMNKKVCRRAIDFFFKHAANPVHISFFGGEPLLNFKIIKYATEYAVKKAKEHGIACSFSFVTNGTICNDEIFEFLTKYKFLLNISLDGPPDIHNRLRKYKSGKPSFNVILKNVKKYFSRWHDKNVIRFSPTIFHENYDKIELLYAFFVDLENKYDISFNSFASINCTEGKKLFALKKTGDFHNMLSEYAKIVLKEAEKEGNLLKLFTKIRMPTDFFRAVFRKQIGTTKCGAGIKAIVVYPDGSTLGCKQLDSSVVRGKNLSWGNIFSSHFDDELRLLPVKDIITGGLPKRCRPCFIRNMCNGLCPGMAYNANEDFTDPDPNICETQKAYCKLSIWMFAKAQEKGLPLTNDLLEYRITYGGL